MEPVPEPATLSLLAAGALAAIRRRSRCATIQREGTETSLFAGRYVTLADIAATGLRRFEGWPMPRYAA